jgi:hypothetical protein
MKGRLRWREVVEGLEGRRGTQIVEEEREESVEKR